VRDEYFRTPGARIRYRVSGRGPAVVFVHGWALDLDMWAPQFALLAARFRVIAFDRRGFGLSAGEPDAGRDVDDLRALLDELSVPAAALVGMSQGARTALAFAASLPGRASCLVLDGPPRVDARDDEASGTEVPIARYRELAARGDLAAVRREWAAHPLTRLHTADPAAHALLAEIVTRYPGRDLSVVEANAPSLAEMLHSLRAPALVVNGAEDSVERRSAGVALARALPGARRVLVAGAGHIPSLDAPAEYCDLLTEFVETHARAHPGSAPPRATRCAER
jgi:pimeloyl-ACP methyl ester carboxylesterase